MSLTQFLRIYVMSNMLQIWFTHDYLRVDVIIVNRTYKIIIKKLYVNCTANPIVCFYVFLRIKYTVKSLEHIGTFVRKLRTKRASGNVPFTRKFTSFSDYPVPAPQLSCGDRDSVLFFGIFSDTQLRHRNSVAGPELRSPAP